MARVQSKQDRSVVVLTIYVALITYRFGLPDRSAIASWLERAAGQVISALRRVPGDPVGMAVAGQAWAGVSAMRGTAVRLRSVSEPQQIDQAKEQLAAKIDQIAGRIAAILEVPIVWLAWTLRSEERSPENARWLTCQNTGSMAAVMVCQCCGQYSVELIYLDVARGARPRLRVRHGQYYLGDYANAFEVAEMLRKRGVLDQLIEAPAGTRPGKERTNDR